MNARTHVVLCLTCMLCFCLTTYDSALATGWDLEPEDSGRAENQSLGAAKPSHYLEDIGKLIPELDKPKEEYQAIAVDILKGTPVESPTAAKAYQEYARSRERQEEFNKSTVDIIKDLFAVYAEQGISQQAIENFVGQNNEPDEYASRHILVFVSSSMPDAAIRKFMGFLGHNEFTSFIIRGPIGNDVSKILPTQVWVKKFLCQGDGDSASCAAAPIDINPILYERFKITQVPAIVYVPAPDIMLASCDSGMELQEDDFLVYYGDFSPLVALNKFKEARPHDDTLSSIVNSITRTGFFQNHKE